MFFSSELLIYVLSTKLVFFLFYILLYKCITTRQ